MPLKDQLTLPTKLDAIAVRPESLPVPAGKTERRELRTVNGKTFVHAEKAPDGKEIRTCTAQIGAVCYRDDTGELRSIDTTIRNLGTHVGIEWAPYKFRLHESGIGFDFESREGDTCTVTLTGIGGEKFEDSPKPEVSDNVITYRDVRPGCDIVFRCLNERVKTLRILRDDKAPRTFDWSVTSDKPELIDSTLTGTDAAGNQLELSASVNDEVITETWSGKASTQFVGESANVVYPVEIDPTITMHPAVGADDGYEVTGAFTNNTTFLFFGNVGGTSTHWGVRFPSVTLPVGATVSSATVGFNIATSSGVGASGAIYGRAADNPAAFDASNLPASVARTTALTAVPSYSTLGVKTYTVTGIVTELGERAGWASGNAMALMGIQSASPGNYVTYDSYEDGSDIPYLEVTYTAAAGGTAANLLLLGCG